MNPWQEFEALLPSARREAVPAVDVVDRVLLQIARSPAPLLRPQDRIVLWAATVSSLVAATILFAAWTSAEMLTEPSAAWFQPFEVALLERP